MEWRPKLSTYFSLVVVLIVVIIGWIAYASRTNAAANIWDEDKDVSSPYYSNHNDVNESFGTFKEEYGAEGKEEEKAGENKEGHGKSDVISSPEEKGSAKETTPVDTTK